ncbi:serine/threonine-protein kinase haspin [Tripterygium wilfordii]|uniref:non-specific serine/threonine protein kinase n=1 Tax=Tripterygium wilfordii TaxID=458696 RepID=A0A7J7C641_TRIWF|nr:serine/threonine-protein kinase haspin homolog [Tripterygium wilfordii]KAF5729236.1 serine/threonine-protein kinase haspin [Tripterygium wilfordii]
MDNKAGTSGDDLWAEIVGPNHHERNRQPRQQEQSEVGGVYRRRKPQKPSQKDLDLKRVDSITINRVSFAAAGKRVSWNRSLSTRGRTSIAVGACVVNQPQKKQARRKAKPALPRGKVVPPPNFEKESAYFKEVDAFELLEESPSPKKFGTWVGSENQTDDVAISYLSSRLEKWLMSKKLNNNCGPSSTLSKILGVPPMRLESVDDDDLDSLNLKTPEKSSSHSKSINSSLLEKCVLRMDINLEKRNKVLVNEHVNCCEDIETAVKKLSLASASVPFAHDHPFSALLAVCGQSAPSKLLEVFSKYCDPNSIVKVGEGTFGEAFRAGNCVCKIVPINGELRVNGEVQKRSEELLEEVVLSRTLNCLRGIDDGAHNACTTFIETLDLQVCQGSYDPALIKAWEDWDENNGSENDHPKDFPEKQCYVVFILQHGGKDLESFVLLNFDEARSLLVQVTAALAVAEAAYDFEHRDLHWGNVLLTRNDTVTLKFTLEGKQIFVKTYGLVISIIDFTLSRINTGEDILFLDLSTDPDLFKGPKGDKQSETYRKMKEVTNDFWEGSFPKTNVLWLIYLVDMLLMKKTFARSCKDERELRSLRKNLNKFHSAREAIFDPFFTNLFVDNTDVNNE